MKSTQIQEQFLLTTPEEQLKELSFVDSVEKKSFQSPRVRNSSNQKFTIQSWDISQKFLPFGKEQGRYKETIQTVFKSTIRNNRYRAKSAYLKKDIQSHNSHNFNSKKNENNSIKSSLFDKDKTIHTSNYRNSLIQKKQHEKGTRNQQIIKRKSQDRIVKKRVEERKKTIQNYLSHKKEQIIREKQMIFSQRTGKQKLSIVLYPTCYNKFESNNSVKNITVNPNKKLQNKLRTNAKKKPFFLKLKSSSKEQSKTLSNDKWTISQQHQFQTTKFNQQKNKMQDLHIHTIDQQNAQTQFNSKSPSKISINSIRKKPNLQHSFVFSPTTHIQPSHQIQSSSDSTSCQSPKKRFYYFLQKLNNFNL